MIRVVLPTNGAVTGTVRAARSGRPVPEASVTLVDGDGDVVASAVTGADGRYEFGDVPTGTYTLTAAGYAPVATRVELDGGRLDCDLALGTPRPAVPDDDVIVMDAPGADQLGASLATTAEDDLPAGHRAHDEERLLAGDDPVGERRVR